MLHGLVAFLAFVAVGICKATPKAFGVAEISPAGSPRRPPALQSVADDAVVGPRSATAATGEAARSPVDQLIPWLLDEDRQLRGIPFSEVIVDVTGKKVFAFDPQNEIERRAVKQISAVLDEVKRRMNAPDSPIQNIARINEASSHFEDMIRELLNSAPGFSCDFPRTAEGRVQRSGYPDLRLVDLASKRVFYLDPKLYAVGSRDSSFRTFYFEPKIATNKVRDDAVHFIIGFEHESREKNGRWNFTRWDVVDLAHFQVKLKAEFQGSNHDLYRPEAVVASSVGRDSVEPKK